MESLIRDFLAFWHAYRIDFFFLICLVIVVVRTFSHFSVRRAEHAVPSSPSEEKSQARSLLQPPIQPRALRHQQDDKSDGPKRIIGVRRENSSRKIDIASQTTQLQLKIFYYSLGGSTAEYAQGLRLSVSNGTSPCTFGNIEVHDLAEIDFDSFFVSPAKQEGAQAFYIFLLPTYNIDSELDTFIQSLEETHNDFRIDTAPLQTIAGYSVFGFGDSEGWPTEREGFCLQAIEVDKWMARLSGGRRAFPIGLGDIRSNMEQKLAAWQSDVLDVCSGIMRGNGLGEGVPGSGDAVESADEDSALENSDGEIIPARLSKKRKRRAPAADLEDIRAPPDAADLEIDFTTTTLSKPAPKEMVPKTSTTYSSLTKQGYTIVGSHTGVKICRWTKSALRGRGSCYKYSFYGIASHRCMEATPSLSCSNKCVFCWRHGTNPVSTTWRWTVDPPELVFEGIKAGHYAKIKSLRGVPGVRAERFQEGMQIRHCALSLVGEPIFYPHINELVGMLHKERISTFLVCNAQHPAQLRALRKVTQLYVSIDAPTKDRLKKVDRPLHRDFWERFLECMDILRQRRDEQRTVFRLTLVKGFNLDDEAEKEAMREDVKGYADLIQRAQPGFVEIKGVTYCGTSTSAAAGLTMRNVPFYEEVCSFVEALDKELGSRGLGYGIAAEHAHSCCILMAERKRFLKSDGWHTLIDYKAFFEQLEAGAEFGPEDYVGAQTPEWALYGNGGFDPRDQRVDRKGKPKA